MSLLLSHAGTRVAHDVVDRLLETDRFRVLNVEPSLAERAVEQFHQYDDQAISLTDHVIGLQARDYRIEHILTYGFQTLGFTALPRE
nr:hypothetical protein [Saliphagus infecundisoli]